MSKAEICVFEKEMTVKMRIVVLDSKTLGKDLDLSLLKELGDVTVYDNTAADEVEERIRKCDVCIINKIRLSESNLKNAGNLKLICLAATGYDNVDTDYCKKAKIGVCNVEGYSTHSVSQLTVTMVLSLMTHIFDYTEYVNSGRYQVSGAANHLEPVYHQIYGKTWGIVGLGNIGRQVARVAEVMGCRVVCCRRTKDKEFETVDIDTLVSESDIISVHTPLNESTKNLISRERIGKMKKNAVFINAARGGVADEEALCEAILENKIGALGIDVYTIEPFDKKHPYNKILGRKNVCLTPHMAWASIEARRCCLKEIISNIEAFYRGEIRNRVDI